MEARDGCLYGVTSQGGAAYGTIYRTCSGVTTNVFAFSQSNGSRPEAGMTLASDGRLYGTTRFGGPSNKGTIFRFDPASGQLTTLHSFTGTNGGEPRGELIQASDGRLYGVASVGGSSNNGVVFAIDTTGSGFAVLRSFAGTNGRIPIGGLAEGPDGNLYGTTSAGGSTALGTVFRITPSGVLTTLVTFTGANGAAPNGRLTAASDGRLYGTAPGGGAASKGTVFRLSTDGQFAVLQSFTGTNGSSPYAGVTQGTDGLFYGVTMSGGSASSGVIFRMDASGNITVLRSLSTNDGINPEAALIQAGNNRFYGTALAKGPAGASGTLFEISPTGSFTRIHAFSGTPAAPRGQLLRGNDNMLYGTSSKGGSSSAGTVFRLSGSRFEILHEFGGLLDGQLPYDGLTQAADGTIYGGTVKGGVSNLGSIFKLPADGLLTRLVSLTETGVAGYNPYASPIQGTDGSFYGVTAIGGASWAGTIYKMTAAGVTSAAFTFNGTSQGKSPYGRLALGSGGVLYGTTALGGSANQGTLFRYDPIARAFSVLHSFSGADGAVLYSGVVEGSDGRLYGMTYRGGANGLGTVFAYDVAARRLTTLRSFGLSDGAYPYSSLFEASDGRLYGTTSAGGSSNLGVVFSLAKDGSGFSVLHHFNGSNGSAPYGGVVEGADGYLYGTTPAGGSTNNGVVYRVSRAGGASAPSTPAAPSNLSATAISSSRIDLAWQDNSNNESEFRIERCTGAGCTNFVVITVVGPGTRTYSNQGIAASTTYQYRVRAANSAGTSGYSNVDSATTAAATTSMPAAPANLGASAVSASRIDLAWADNSTNETEFRIERCQGAGCTNFTQIGIAAADVRTFIDTLCNSGTTYGYRVRAANTAGASAPSNSASATTPTPTAGSPGPGVNVALAANGAVARASSTKSTSKAPGLAINGDHKGMNWSAGGAWVEATPGAYPDWLEVEFNTSYAIQRIDVFGVQDNYLNPVEPTPTTVSKNYALTSFEVQYWNGSTWATVSGGTITGNTLVWRSITLATPITTNKIRVKVNAAKDGVSRIVEVEAFTAGQ